MAIETVTIESAAVILQQDTGIPETVDSYLRTQVLNPADISNGIKIF